MEYMEIDLRRYIDAIRKHGYWIALLTLAAALGTAALTMTKQRTYVATATVLTIVRQTSSQLGTDDSLLSLESIDMNARRHGLLILAQSDAVEARLPADVVQRVVPNDYKPGMMVTDGQVEAAPQGDLIEITATAAEPELAKELADAWAQTFVDYVEPLYTDEHSEVKLASTAVLPYRPEATGLVRNTLLAGAAGLLLGVGLALLLELMRKPALSRRQGEGERIIGEPSPSR